MNSNRPGPPRLAIWLLRHACPGNDHEALIGDLIEMFREGQTYRWLWRQVLIAIAAGVLGETRRHWPYVCYALAATAISAFFWDAVPRVPGWLHWWTLPWPWSQLAFEVSRPTVLALGALPVLAAGLVINRAFRWASLFRTGAINLVLIILGNYLFDLCPWLLRPVPGNPYLRVLIFPFPPVLQMLLSFSTFIVAAKLGSLQPRHAKTTGRPNEERRA